MLVQQLLTKKELHEFIEMLEQAIEQKSTELSSTILLYIQEELLLCHYWLAVKDPRRRASMRTLRLAG